jgi:hypothetical protein
MKNMIITIGIVIAGVFTPALFVFILMYLLTSCSTNETIYVKDCSLQPITKRCIERPTRSIKEIN